MNGPDGQTLPPLYDDREGFVRPSRQRKQSSIRAICKRNKRKAKNSEILM